MEYKIVRFQVPQDKLGSHEEIDKIVENILNGWAKKGWKLHESGFGLMTSNALLLYRSKNVGK